MESGPAHAPDEARKSQAPEHEAAQGLEAGDLQAAGAGARVLRRADDARLTRGQVGAIQRLAGNRAVAQALAHRPRANSIQRHTEGTELPNKEEQVQEIEQKAKAEPERSSATRTKKEEKEQKGEAKKEGKAFQKKQKLTPGAMNLAAAQSILQGQFGGTKDIVPGTIEILADQPACAAKYDEIQIARGVLRPDGSAWQMGDCAKDDAAEGVLTQGFAEGGIVYVNGETTLVTATAHEILHNNVAAGFRAAVGETFNEGVTELLARRALKAAGVKVPSVTAYPDQVKFTEKLEKLVGEKVLSDAYFSGAAGLISKFEELKGVGTFVTLKTHAEALDEEAFKKALAAKKAK